MNMKLLHPPETHFHSIMARWITPFVALVVLAFANVAHGCNPAQMPGVWTELYPYPGVPDAPTCQGMCQGTALCTVEAQLKFEWKFDLMHFS